MLGNVALVELIGGLNAGRFRGQKMRDKASYRAAFTCRDRPWNTAAGDPPMTAGVPQIVPRPSAAAPALRAADQGVTSALESVLSDNTQRVYAAQWRLFTDWCDEMGLRSMPAEPLTVARYLAVRAVGGASIAHPAPGRLRHRQGSPVGGP